MTRPRRRESPESEKATSAVPGLARVPNKIKFDFDIVGQAA